jgi:hypothetical protein
MMYKRSFLGIPIARRSNRRWLVVAYWTFAISLAMAAIASLKAHPQWNESPHFAFTFILTYTFIFGSAALRRMVLDTSFAPEQASGGIRTLFDSALRGKKIKDQRKNDERDQREWDRAHTKAYALLSLFAIFALLPLQFWQLIPSNSQFRQPMILFLLLVVLNLPQSILFWNEPDMEEAE